MSTTTAKPRYTEPLLIFIAMIELAKIKAARAEYEQDVRDWYERGDGRPKRVLPVDQGGNVTPGLQTHYEGDDGYLEPYDAYNFGGQGYSYPTCIHGSSLWTDYDNICGPCEDGWSDYQVALATAHRVKREWDRRCKVYAAFRDTIIDDIRDDKVKNAYDSIAAWVEEPMSEYIGWKRSVRPLP